MDKTNTIYLLILLIFVGCSPADESKAVPQKSLTTVTVCEAAQKSTNSRVRIEGIFDGFTYAIGSKEITLESSKTCNSEGAGLVFASLKNGNEKERLFQTKPGTRVILEGKINKVEESRFVYISNAIVISN
ncbi:MAG: hypothetical protein ABJH08_09325 [Balneola sp.]